VDVVDDDGRPVAVVTRREMRAHHLPHRSTYILVFDTRGWLFVHLRTATKDAYPSHWDPCAGGVLAPGEDFGVGAARELAEELGVNAPLEELFPFRWQDPFNVVHGMVYRVVHDGPFRLQPDEVVRGEFLPLEMVEERARWEPFCPDGLAVVREYRNRVSEPRR
jgi:8-oxo-dGTP pyrophosphatase MutT (NUDIX family)